MGGEGTLARNLIEEGQSVSDIARTFNVNTRVASLRPVTTLTGIADHVQPGITDHFHRNAQSPIDFEKSYQDAA